MARRACFGAAAADTPQPKSMRVALHTRLTPSSLFDDDTQLRSFRTLCLLASAYDNITALISLSSSWSYPYGVGGHTQHEHKPGERDYACNNACAPPGPKQSQMACRCGSTAIGCSGATWRWSLGREERVAGFALVQTYSRLLQSTLERVLGATPEHSAAPATLETPLHSGDKVFLPDGVGPGGDYDITWAEAVAVELGGEIAEHHNLFGTLPPGSRVVRVRSDNTAVVSVVNAGRAFSERTNQVITSPIIYGVDG
ncbi:uncharacterized protein BXZ73DRAFT_80826 [Epithele typhae]|uniref:uncharacterized protein n=1 Tax=Epithele typhae TaxID=378194 RepID=UPI0020086A0B|nr:uncharacterized protein BXZ73DRAFT_80826 [Epithele typhae]KAH9917377.1 hypothetical protein BXZ73DRAFT_80826 [Epithele typhae]